MPSASGRPLVEIDTWIFDLDNTLYPVSCRLFDQIHDRMTRFIADRMALTLEAALTVQKTYFREHGATLRGLMTVDRIDPEDFLAFVHEVDLSCVPRDPVLVEALSALPGRKIVHTNGSRRHAERVLDHLGIAKLFCGIVDIVASDFEPKPALTGYHLLLKRYAVKPETALMVEDIARNLAPAAELGMTTAWVRNDVDWARSEADRAFIHHIVDDLAGFLAAAAALQGSGQRERQ